MTIEVFMMESGQIINFNFFHFLRYCPFERQHCCFMAVPSAAIPSAAIMRHHGLFNGGIFVTLLACDTFRFFPS